MNIIELAKQADAAHDDVAITPFLERFAHLVRAQALEEAAGVCDEHANASKLVYTGISAMHCAAAIRALKDKT